MALAGVRVLQAILQPSCPTLASLHADARIACDHRVALLSWKKRAEGDVSNGLAAPKNKLLIAPNAPFGCVERRLQLSFMALSHPSAERRKTRIGLKVVHQHRMGGEVSERVSDLVFADGKPHALIEWINIGGVRTPLYTCELDKTKLVPASDAKAAFYYVGVTTDPRFNFGVG